MVLIVGLLLGHAQDPVTLQFTGQNQNGQHVPLTSVLVENTTKHWQEVLYYPDTTFSSDKPELKRMNNPATVCNFSRMYPILSTG